MKEAIRMVPEVIYNNISVRSSGCQSQSILRQIKEEWGTFSWFLELDIRKCFHTIDRHRLIPIFKEEIDDAQFFYPILKIFYGGEKAHSVLLSPGNIYLQHKLDQEIWRIRHKYEIPIVQRILLLMTGRIDAPENNNYSEEDNNTKESKDTIPTKYGRLSTMYKKEHLKILFTFSAEAFLNKPSSLLFASELFFGIKQRCNKSNWPMRDLFLKLKYCIKSGGAERALARRNLNNYLIRIYHARYADDSLLGIMGGTLDLLIEIHKRIAHFIIQSGSNPQAVYAASRSTVEFPGTVIRVPPSPHPLQFRELEKRKRLKHRIIHITACQLRSALHSNYKNKKLFRDRSKPIKLQPKVGYLLGALNDTLLVSGLWRSDVIQAVRKLSSLRDFSSIKIEAPIKKILRRLQDRGFISRIKPRPLHVACLTNLSDGDIVNWSAGIAISPLSYYRCRDNLYQVRTIVDYQIRWSAIFTLAHKHKSSVRNIISLYSKDINI
nr:maturase R [Balanophora reflexa]